MKPHYRLHVRRGRYWPDVLYWRVKGPNGYTEWYRDCRDAVRAARRY